MIKRWSECTTRGARAIASSARAAAERLAYIAVLATLATPCFAQVEPTEGGGRFEGMRGCEVRYSVHRAPVADNGPVALIAHGFLRRGEFMDGWARAFVAVGVTAVTVDLCSSSMPQGRHADNGADLVALRRALGIDEAIYVGVSAGGLAALVAAASDGEGTRGLLLLDPVNAGGQARSAAGRVRAPVLAMVAKPQICNAWRNIDRALETMPQATIVAIDRASHCDFEWPTDRFCRFACLATNSHEERDRAAARVRTLGVSFVEAVATGRADQWKIDVEGNGSADSAIAPIR